jgi:hypothetical protein
MRRSMVLVLFLMAMTCGCHSNKRYDTIEAELRTKDRELIETRIALERSQNLNRAYEQSLRAQSQVSGQPTGRAPISTCSIREIVLARGTGGVDEDGLPGDESLMVVIVPRDEDRSEIKIAARAQIAVWEVTPQGLKNLIGNWDISPERLRPTWRNSVISTGYFVAIPWQTFPTTEKIRIAVRLTTVDGQTFETERDIMVKLVPQAQPRRPAIEREPLYPGNPPPGIPPGVEELPPPAGLVPGRSASLLPPLKP